MIISCKDFIAGFVYVWPLLPFRYYCGWLSFCLGAVLGLPAYFLCVLIRLCQQRSSSWSRSADPNNYKGHFCQAQAKKLWLSASVLAQPMTP
jgi:hypothetical protein